MKGPQLIELRRVRRLFNSDYVSREANRAHMRKYIKMRRMLGLNWLGHPQDKATQSREVLVVGVL